MKVSGQFQALVVIPPVWTESWSGQSGEENMIAICGIE